MSSIHIKMALAAGGLALTTGMGSAAAQSGNYPDKTVTVVVPYAPGGATDRLGRVVAQGLGNIWDVPVVVENRGGAGGNVGAEYVARAEDDGYTLLFTASNVFTVTPHMMQASFDPFEDFAPVSMAAHEMFAVVVPAALPVDNLQELLDMARENPGELTYGSPGVGSPHNLGNEYLKSMADLDIRHVPYKGAAPAMPDLLAGRIDMWMGGIISVLPHIKEGTLKALAVTGGERSDVLPDVPTVDEAGVDGYELLSSFALVAPADTDPAIIEKINHAMVELLGRESIRSALAKEGIDAVSSSPEALAQMMRDDSERWGKIIRDAGLRAE